MCNAVWEEVPGIEKVRGERSRDPAHNPLHVDGFEPQHVTYSPS